MFIVLAILLALAVPVSYLLTDSFGLALMFFFWSLISTAAAGAIWYLMRR